MRKFLMAAAVLAVAACGEAAEEGMEDTTTMAPAPAEQMEEMADSMDTIVDSMKTIADSMSSTDTTHQM